MEKQVFGQKGPLASIDMAAMFKGEDMDELHVVEKDKSVTVYKGFAFEVDLSDDGKQHSLENRMKNAGFLSAGEFLKSLDNAILKVNSTDCTEMVNGVVFIENDSDNDDAKDFYFFIV